jgi:hypothetical protein
MLNRVAIEGRCEYAIVIDVVDCYCRSEVTDRGIPEGLPALVGELDLPIIIILAVKKYSVRARRGYGRIRCAERQFRVVPTSDMGAVEIIPKYITVGTSYT